MPRPNTYPLIFEESAIIDIKNLTAWGCFVSYCYASGQMTWRCYGEVTSRLNYQVANLPGKPSLRLSYAYRGEPVSYEIPIETRPSNLGTGLVRHFRCPVTGLLCRKLYLSGGRFVHRKAAAGFYDAQRQSKRARLYNRAYGAYFRRSEVWEEWYKPYAKQTYRGIPTARYLRFEKRLGRLGETLTRHGSLLMPTRQQTEDALAFFAAALAAPVTL